VNADHPNTGHHPPAEQRRLVVPYATRWSTEDDAPFEVVYRPGGGIAYADEVTTDRDSDGVLWTRGYSRPRVGRPEFGKVHSMRQRRAMRRLLCQVCGGPAEQDEDGVLWLLPDHREDWSDWPNGAGEVEPPICRACAEISLRLCPALRRGGVLVRVREYPIAGVRGVRYEPGLTKPVMAEPVLVPFDHHAIRWIRATGLVRELNDCTLLSAGDFLDTVS
jgi:hypothetical protein